MGDFYKEPKKLKQKKVKVAGLLTPEPKPKKSDRFIPLQRKK
jgi:hypothetical protein